MTVSGLGNFALGQAVPSRDHAVCVSLPKVQDLIGYEEKNPKTLSAMKSGYPRFIQHHFIRQLIQLEEDSDEYTGKSFIFAHYQHCQEALKKCAVQNYRIQERENYTWLQLPNGSKEIEDVSSFVQHIGASLSSRQAEEVLLNKGIIQEREEITEHESPDQFAREIIAEVHGAGVSADRVLISSSGANAFYSLFRTAFQHYLEKGKNIWIRLGWLYLDTIETMELFAGEEESKIITITDLKNLEPLQEIFSKHGQKIAGIVTEFPTNPLLKSCDLEKVRELCNQSNALLIVDPTMASPKNAKVANLGDVLVNSLTKYASWQGDLMIGSLVFPDHSQLGSELFESTNNYLHPPFKRDLLHLCEQLPYYPEFVQKTNNTLIQVVDFLESHPRVKKVFWSYQNDSADYFRKIAGDEKPGCVVSFEVTGDFTSFYNQLRMLKSPSFGTEFSLCCPYVYLAHYKLMQSKAGLNQLKSAGISPYLCRLSVGLEEPEEIIQTLQVALQGME